MYTIHKELKSGNRAENLEQKIIQIVYSSLLYLVISDEMSKKDAEKLITSYMRDHFETEVSPVLLHSGLKMDRDELIEDFPFIMIHLPDQERKYIREEIVKFSRNLNNPENCLSELLPSIC